MYAIDPHKGKVSGGQFQRTYRSFLRNISKAGVRKRIVPIVKTSVDANRSWRKPVKLLFIDGLHDELHALEDYRLWSRQIIDGGIVAMHDAFCGWEGAGSVASANIVRNDRYGEIGVIGSIIYGIKGKTKGILRIKRLCNKLVIELCINIYKSHWIPKRIQFILVHKILRILLINRFTSF